MADTKALMRQRVGQGVSVSKDTFTPEQVQLFENIIGIVDRNPVIEWRRGDPNHNQDFCLIEGKLEPVKSFHQKAAYLAGVSIIADPKVSAIETKDDTKVTVAVTVKKGDRTVTMNGGSSTKECRAPKNSRAWHDAVARAQTRALKVALENLLGFAFINLVMLEVFGGYGIDEAPEDVGLRNVTPGHDHEPEHSGTLPPRPKEGTKLHTIVSDIWEYIGRARNAGLLIDTDAAEYWRRTRYNWDNENTLVNVFAQLRQDVANAADRAKPGSGDEWR